MKTIKTQTGRTIKVGTLNEEFYTVQMVQGDIVLVKAFQKRGNTQHRRQIIDINGYMGFKFKGNKYQLDHKTVGVR